MLDVMLLPVFQLLYFVAHFLVSLLQSGIATFTDLCMFLRSLYKRVSGNSQAVDLLTLHGCTKVPHHAAIVVLPGELPQHSHSSHIHQLCEVLSHLVKAGSSQLTAYDATGVLYNERDLIKDSLQSLVSEDSRVVLTTPAAHSQHSQDDAKEMTSHKCTEAQGNASMRQRRANGCETIVSASDEAQSQCCQPVGDDSKGGIRQVYLHVQCYKSAVLDAMLRTTINQLASQQEHLKSLAVPQLNDLLYANTYGGAIKKEASCVRVEPNTMKLDGETKTAQREEVLRNDPDLVLVIGEMLISNGLPCWFLRLSEFVLIPSLRRAADVGVLASVLCRFSKKEQRFGR